MTILTGTQAVLRQVSHRPYELPTRPWSMTQTWSKLLFAHWPVDVDQVQALVPNSLTVDKYDGAAWVGVVPFAMQDVRFRFLSAFESNFCELNVRTYVSYKGKPGVYFFSLDANNPFAVEVARAAFRLPYFHSQMSINDSAGAVRYDSQRHDWRGSPLQLAATYRPIGEVAYSVKGSVEEFLTERYRLFTCGAGTRIMSCDVHHKQWPLQPA